MEYRRIPFLFAPLKKVLCVMLAACLLWTSGAAEAARNSAPHLPVTPTAIFTEQAICQSLVSGLLQFFGYRTWTTVDPEIRRRVYSTQHETVQGAVRRYLVLAVQEHRIQLIVSSNIIPVWESVVNTLRSSVSAIEFGALMNALYEQAARNLYSSGRLRPGMIDGPPVVQLIGEEMLQLISPSRTFDEDPRFPTKEQTGHPHANTTRRQPRSQSLPGVEVVIEHLDNIISSLDLYDQGHVIDDPSLNSFLIIASDGFALKYLSDWPPVFRHWESLITLAFTQFAQTSPENPYADDMQNVAHNLGRFRRLIAQLSGYPLDDQVENRTGSPLSIPQVNVALRFLQLNPQTATWSEIREKSRAGLRANHVDTGKDNIELRTKYQEAYNELKKHKPFFEARETPPTPPSAISAGPIIIGTLDKTSSGSSRPIVPKGGRVRGVSITEANTIRRAPRTLQEAANEAEDAVNYARSFEGDHVIEAIGRLSRALGQLEPFPQAQNPAIDKAHLIQRLTFYLDTLRTAAKMLEDLETLTPATVILKKDYIFPKVWLIRPYCNALVNGLTARFSDSSLVISLMAGWLETNSEVKEAVPLRAILAARSEESIRQRGVALLANRGASCESLSSLQEALDQLGTSRAVDQIAVATAYFWNKHHLVLEIITDDKHTLVKDHDGTVQQASVFLPQERELLIERLVAWSNVLDRFKSPIGELFPSFERILVIGSGRDFHGTFAGAMVLAINNSKDSKGDVFAHELGHVVDPGTIHSNSYYRDKPKVKGYEKVFRNPDLFMRLVHFAEALGLGSYLGYESARPMAELVTSMYFIRCDLWKMLNRSPEFYDQSPNRQRGILEGFLQDLLEDRQMMASRGHLLDATRLPQIMQKYDETIANVQKVLADPARRPSGETQQDLLTLRTALALDIKPALWNSTQEYGDILSHEYTYEVPMGDDATVLSDPQTSVRLREKHNEWWAERVKLYLSNPERLKAIDEQSYELVHIYLSPLLKADGAVQENSVSHLANLVPSGVSNPSRTHHTRHALDATSGAPSAPPAIEPASGSTLTHGFTRVVGNFVGGLLRLYYRTTGQQEKADVVGRRGSDDRRYWLQEKFAPAFEKFFFLLFAEVFEDSHGMIAPRIKDEMPQSEKEDELVRVMLLHAERRQTSRSLGQLARDKFQDLLKTHPNARSAPSFIGEFVLKQLGDVGLLWLQVLLNVGLAAMAANETIEPHAAYNVRHRSDGAALTLGSKENPSSLMAMLTRAWVGIRDVVMLLVSPSYIPRYEIPVHTIHEIGPPAHGASVEDVRLSRQDFISSLRLASHTSGSRISHALYDIADITSASYIPWHLNDLYARYTARTYFDPAIMLGDLYRETRDFTKSLLTPMRLGWNAILHRSSQGSILEEPTERLRIDSNVSERHLFNFRLPLSEGGPQKQPRKSIGGHTFGFEFEFLIHDQINEPRGKEFPENEWRKKWASVIKPLKEVLPPGWELEGNPERSFIEIRMPSDPELVYHDTPEDWVRFRSTLAQIQKLLPGGIYSVHQHVGREDLVVNGKQLNVDAGRFARVVKTYEAMWRVLAGRGYSQIGGTGVSPLNKEALTDASAGRRHYGMINLNYHHPTIEFKIMTGLLNENGHLDLESLESDVRWTFALLDAVAEKDERMPLAVLGIPTVAGDKPRQKQIDRFIDLFFGSNPVAAEHARRAFENVADEPAGLANFQRKLDDKRIEIEGAFRNMGLHEVYDLHNHFDGWDEDIVEHLLRPSTLNKLAEDLVSAGHPMDVVLGFFPAEMHDALLAAMSTVPKIASPAVSIPDWIQDSFISASLDSLRLSSASRDPLHAPFDLAEAERHISAYRSQSWQAVKEHRLDWSNFPPSDVDNFTFDGNNFTNQETLIHHSQLIVQPQPASPINWKIFRLLFLSAFPKRTPYGLTGFIFSSVGIIASIVAAVLGHISLDQAGALIAGSLVVGLYFGLSAMIYGYYLNDIHDGSPAYRNPEYENASPLQLAQRVNEQMTREFGLARTEGVTVIIPEEIVGLNESEFSKIVGDETARLSFGLGSYFSRETGHLYVNNYGKPGAHVNNALFDQYRKILYVHQNAARAYVRALGLVLAHEMGKKACFANSWSGSILKQRLYAELVGNFYEFLYFFHIPIHRIPPSNTVGSFKLPKLVNRFIIFSMVNLIVIMPWVGLFTGPSYYVYASLALAAVGSLLLIGRGITRIIPKRNPAQKRDRGPLFGTIGSEVFEKDSLKHLIHILAVAPVLETIVFCLVLGHNLGFSGNAIGLYFAAAHLIASWVIRGWRARHDGVRGVLKAVFHPWLLGQDLFHFIVLYGLSWLYLSPYTLHHYLSMRYGNPDPHLSLIMVTVLSMLIHACYNAALISKNLPELFPFWQELMPKSSIAASATPDKTNLLMEIRKRITIVTDKPEVREAAEIQLNDDFAKVAKRRRPLSRHEQDLFNFFISGPGKDIPIEFRPEEVSGMGNWDYENDRGIPYAWFGQQDHKNYDPRSDYELFKHELSHTMDGMNELAGRSPDISGYTKFPIPKYAPKQYLSFREFRANLWTYDGDFVEALRVTKLMNSAMQNMMEFFPEGYSPEKIYEVLTLLVRNNVDRYLYPDKELDRKEVAQYIAEVDAAYVKRTGIDRSRSRRSRFEGAMRGGA